MKKAKTITGLFILTGTLLLLYTAVIERYIVTVNHYEITAPNIPVPFDGFKIAVLADIHYGSLMPKFWIRNIIERTNSAGADIIVCGGDYVHRKNRTDELREIWPILNSLSAPFGVYMVNGNHDHWADKNISLKLLEESGKSVRHKHRFISKGGDIIAVAGAGDFYEDTSGYSQALKGIPENIYRIMIAHNPDTADIPHNERVDLFICGHTHGGQVIIPFINYAPIIPVNNKEYDSSIKKNAKGEQIFISRGLGWAILPVRFNCFPEIAVITLKKGTIAK